jgi:hypothetical protein
MIQKASPLTLILDMIDIKIAVRLINRFEEETGFNKVV